MPEPEFSNSPEINPLRLSIVIPVMNEEGNVDRLWHELSSVLKSIQRSYEIIFIDDGSTDETVARIEAITRQDSRTRAIVFRRNFGKSAALMAGFRAAQGEVIVTMDGDLQDEPTELPKMLAKLDEGYDLVSGWKKERHDPIEKVLASRVFNGIISRITGVKLHDFNCGYKVYRRWAVQNIKLSGNLYRFIPVFVKRQGGEIAELAVRHNKRVSGKSKFGFKRYFHGLFDMFTVILLSSFFHRPMYFFGIVGTPLIGIGVTSLAYLFGRHVIWLVTGDLTYQLNNRPLLLIAFGLCGLGLNILLVGLLSEMILHLSPATGADSLYSVARRLGFSSREMVVNGKDVSESRPSV